jgi:hypothetical protein
VTEILFVIKDDPEVDSTLRTHAQRGSCNKYARIARDPPVRRSTTWSEALLPWHPTGPLDRKTFDQGLLASILASMSDACSLVTPACRRCAAGRGIFNECLDMGGVGFSMTKNQYPLVGCVNCAGNCSLKEY